MIDVVHVIPRPRAMPRPMPLHLQLFVSCASLMYYFGGNNNELNPTLSCRQTFALSHIINKSRTHPAHNNDCCPCKPHLEALIPIACRCRGQHYARPKRQMRPLRLGPSQSRCDAMPRQLQYISSEGNFAHVAVANLNVLDATGSICSGTHSPIAGLSLLPGGL